MTPADPELKDGADDNKGPIIHARRGRDVERAVEEDGDVDVAGPGAGVSSDKEKDGDGSEGAGNGGVDLGVEESAR